MNRQFYPGRHLHSENNVVKKIVEFQKITTMFETGELIKPIYQGALDGDRVDSMVESYLKYPEYFQFKNTIVVGDINKKFYIIDGQHRVEMISILCKKYHRYKKKLIVAYYRLKNESDALKLFNEINIDSTKNHNYIQLNLFNQIAVNEFRDRLKVYKKCFSNKKTKNGKLKCIEEFVEDLHSVKFFNNTNIEQAFTRLTTLNSIFFKKMYKSHIDDNSYDKLLYKNEIKAIKLGVVFTTKQNNFIEFIKNQEIPLIHRWKKDKKRITKVKKKQAWFKEFGEKTIAVCPVSFCNTQIAYDKRYNGVEVFAAGHIISEYNGGEAEPNNLRPICKSCNSSMGSKNWDDYDLKS